MRFPRWFKKLAKPIADQVTYASGAYIDLKSTINDFAITLIRFDLEPQGDADVRLCQAAERLQPKTTNSLRLVRVGGPNDGGYVMADDFDVEGVISLGVGPDVSWDQDVAARGVSVAMFDPTVRRPPRDVPGSRFFRIGVSGSPRGNDFRTLEDLVVVSGFGIDSELLLKMDVEGAEWESLLNVSSKTMARFRQIIVELHDLESLKAHKGESTIVRVLEKLNESHVPIHTHANNFSRLVRFDGYWFPDAIEVTFLRRDLLSGTVMNAPLPSHLDAPCDPRVSDISLAGLAELSSRNRF